MNTVNPMNFNQTMDGYFKYALNFAMERADFTDEQLKLLGNGMRWAKDEMTMQDARNYAEKY